MEFQSYLSKQYQGHDSFLENIIFPIFGEDNYETAYDVELLDSDDLRNQAARTGIRSILRCGTIMLPLTPIEVFDISVSDRLMMDKNRVGVQAIIRRVMDTYSGAFMLIHYENDTKWDWRFTFCRLRDKKEFTDSKRYTFLLGPNQSCRTAAQNFQKLAELHESITISDIVSAFDVEALSKAFFDDYKKHYERFVEFITGKRFVKEAGKFVEKASHDPHPVFYRAFSCDDKAVRDYTKLLLARIVFLHFLQKKGWLGVPRDGKWGDGDEQFMLHLYKMATEEQKEDFLESVLEPLFFEALNRDRSGKKDLFDTKVLGVVRVPYLNGGLFNKESLDEVVIRYPKEFFGDFLEFLYQYNFTIDENDPNEAQVGIDPEMLGKIFENLLEDNKDKGAFYTPKEIVQYMCQESLVAYLETKTGYGNERLRGFVKDPFVRVSEFSPDEQYTILGAILSVKICDPAIGSGAFPIGLLNELVRCKEAIYGDEKGRAEIKKEIIRDNIYGVDIEKGAVDIARLRFWLSLIVDEEEPLPLPNLDYKIMQGNSLVERFEGVDLSHLVEEGEDDLFMSSAVDLKSRLNSLLKLYFDETDHKKKAEHKKNISTIIKKQLDIAGVDLHDIDVAGNDHFFLWHTWFADVFKDGGFDITIGNPPYLVVTKSTYPHYSWNTDLYKLFFERGIKESLKPSGVLCFITPKFYLLNKDDKAMREYFLTEIELLSLSLCNPFEAVTENVISLFKKQKPSLDTIPCYEYSVTEKHFKRLVDLNKAYCFTNEQTEMIIGLDPQIIQVLAKMRGAHKTLKDISTSKRGAEVGKAYLRSQNTGAKSLIGMDMKKYQVLWNETYLPFNHKEYNRLANFFQKELIYLRRVDNCLEATVSDERYAFNKNVYGIYISDRLAFSIKYVLALLNSTAVDFYYKNKFSTKKTDAFPEIQTYLYEQLPLPQISADKQNVIVNLVDSIMQNKLNGEDTSSLESNVDNLIYEAFNLCDEEITLILNSRDHAD